MVRVLIQIWLSRSWDRNMDIKYKVIITPTAYKEINRIYDYILIDLYAEKAAKNLMRKVENHFAFVDKKVFHNLILLKHILYLLI